MPDPTAVPALGTSIVADGHVVLAAAVALAAGFVSFASPCVLPLVPGFLGYVTGLGADALTTRRRARVLAGAALFVAGFSAVFVAGTLLASALGAALAQHRELLLKRDISSE